MFYNLRLGKIQYFVLIFSIIPAPPDPPRPSIHHASSFLMPCRRNQANAMASGLQSAMGTMGPGLQNAMGSMGQQVQKAAAQAAAQAAANEVQNQFANAMGFGKRK